MASLLGSSQSHRFPIGKMEFSIFPEDMISIVRVLALGNATSKKHTRRDRIIHIYFFLSM